MDQEVSADTPPIDPSSLENQGNDPQQNLDPASTPASAPTPQLPSIVTELPSASVLQNTAYGRWLLKRPDYFSFHVHFLLYNITLFL